MNEKLHATLAWGKRKQSVILSSNRNTNDIRISMGNAIYELDAMADREACSTLNRGLHWVPDGDFETALSTVGIMSDLLLPVPPARFIFLRQNKDFEFSITCEQKNLMWVVTELEPGFEECIEDPFVFGTLAFALCYILGMVVADTKLPVTGLRIDNLQGVVNELDDGAIMALNAIMTVSKIQ